MPALMSTGPQGDNASPKAQLTAGPPKAPLRSAPRQPAYQQNTTAILGDNPLDSQNGGAVGVGEAGLAGKALADVASIMRGVQGLAETFPEMVPPPITLWVQALMQAVPQRIQQQSQSGMSGMANTMAGAMGGPGQSPAGQPMAGPMGGIPGMQ
jgi:hypothetical protein